MRRTLRLLVFAVVLSALSAYLYAHRRFAERQQVPPGATPVTARAQAARARTDPQGRVLLFALARDDAQSQALASYQAVMDDPRASSSARASAGAAYVALTRAVEAEREAENLLHAKGFASAAVLVESHSAVLVLGSARPLTAERVAEAAYTVSEVTGVPLTGIRVVQQP